MGFTPEEHDRMWEEAKKHINEPKEKAANELWHKMQEEERRRKEREEDAAEQTGM